MDEDRVLHQDWQLEDHDAVDVSECLRCRGLELVCSDESRELQPAAERRIVGLPVSSGQMALALGGNVLGDEVREPGLEAVDEQPPASAGKRRQGAVVDTPRQCTSIKILHGCGDPWGQRVSEDDLARQPHTSVWRRELLWPVLMVPSHSRVNPKVGRAKSCFELHLA